MEKSTREALLDAGLELLGRVGFRGWSVRGVEDEAGVPHGSVRHHFSNQQGLVLALVRHLLAADLAHPGDTPARQVERWLGPESIHTRARYELVVASFHDHELASELIRGRDVFVESFVAQGLPPASARALVAALDGMVLDAVLRNLDPSDTDPQTIIDRFAAG